MGSSKFAVDFLSFIGIAASVCGITALPIGFILWRYKPEQLGRVLAATVTLAAAAVVISVAVIFSPLPSAVNNEYTHASVSCGSLIHPRTDFSQYPAGTSANSNSVNSTISGSLQSVGQVYQADAQAACTSVHNTELVATIIAFLGGMGTLLYIAFGPPRKWRRTQQPEEA